MTIARTLVRSITGATGWGPLDDRWYQSVGGASATGVNISAETALQSSTVWAAVRLLADSVASLPLIVYRRRSDGGKDRATDHPLYELLHDAPNPYQTAYAFKRVLMVHALLWGNGYARILPGPRGPVDQLRCLHPDTVRPEQLDDGSVVYHVRQKSGLERILLDDEVFHLPGLSLNGVTGLSVIQYARDSIGLGLAAKQFGATGFGRGVRMSGFMKVKGRLSPDAKERLREEIQATHGGLKGSGSFGIFEEDTDWVTTGMSNEDAQLIGQLEWSSVDTARFFNVPPHMIGETSKVTSWGSGISELSIGFVTYSLMPWLVNWAETIRKDLILANRVYFAEFLTDALLRGDTLKRFQAYSIAIRNQWMVPNEIRERENMNPIAGGDVVPVLQGAAPRIPTGGLAENAALYPFARDAAARVVRKETVAMEKAARRSASDGGAWKTAVEEFYGPHAGYVAETMRLSVEDATAYVDREVGYLLLGGPERAGEREAARVGQLVALALGEQPERMN